MRESTIEKAFVDAVHAEGGMAMKFTSQTMNGVPDRLICHPSNYSRVISSDYFMAVLPQNSLTFT